MNGISWDSRIAAVLYGFLFCFQAFHSSHPPVPSHRTCHPHVTCVGEQSVAIFQPGPNGQGSRKYGEMMFWMMGFLLGQIWYWNYWKNHWIWISCWDMMKEIYVMIHANPCNNRIVDMIICVLPWAIFFIYIYTYIFFTYLYIWFYMYIYMIIYIYAYLYVYICIYIWSYIYIYIYTYDSIYIYIYMVIYIYVYIQDWMGS